MKIELGLRAGIALPLLATLIIGMSGLVFFNYISQINVIKGQEDKEIESAINTTNILLETSSLYQLILNLISNTNFDESYSKLDKIFRKAKMAINSELGFITKKELLSEEVYNKSSKNTFGQWVSIYFTGIDPKQFIFENSISKIEQRKDKYYIDKLSLGDKDYFIIYVPIHDQTGKIYGFIYIIKERILTSFTIFKILSVNILAYIVILILISLLIGYGMHKYVINPIIALTKAADNISLGKTSEKIQIQNAKGEIAILAKSIERMRVTMKKLLE